MLCGCWAEYSTNNRSSQSITLSVSLLTSVDLWRRLGRRVELLEYGCGFGRVCFQLYQSFFSGVETLLFNAQVLSIV